MERGQLFEGEVADDIGVQNKERGVVLAERLLGQLQGAGGAQRLGLNREGDVDTELASNLHEARDVSNTSASVSVQRRSTLVRELSNSPFAPPMHPFPSRSIV